MLDTLPAHVANVKVREKKPFEQLDSVTKLVSEAETELKKQGGRLLLRYSGTRPKARLLLEGRDARVLEKWSQKISARFRNRSERSWSSSVSLFEP